MATDTRHQHLAAARPHADKLARFQVAEVVSAVVDTCSRCGELVCRYGHGIIDGEERLQVQYGAQTVTLCNNCVRGSYARRNSPNQPNTPKPRSRPSAAEANLTNALSRLTVSTRSGTGAAGAATTAPRPHFSTKPRTVRQEPLVDCAICVTTRSGPRRPITSHCTHPTRTCRRCLATHIRHQLSLRAPTATSTGITCPECRSPLSHSDVKAHADLTTFARFDELLTRAAVVREDCFRWCLSPGCGAGQIHDKGEAEPIVVCYECGGRSCYRHMVGWHEGLTCAEYDGGGIPLQQQQQQQQQARRRRQEQQQTREEVSRRLDTKALPAVPGQRVVVRSTAAGGGSGRSQVGTSRPEGRRRIAFAEPVTPRRVEHAPVAAVPTGSAIQAVVPPRKEKKKASTVIGVVQPERHRAPRTRDEEWGWLSLSRQRDGGADAAQAVASAAKSAVSTSRRERHERPTTSSKAKSAVSTRQPESSRREVARVGTGARTEISVRPPASVPPPPRRSSRPSASTTGIPSRELVLGNSKSSSSTPQTPRRSDKVILNKASAKTLTIREGRKESKIHPTRHGVEAPPPPQDETTLLIQRRLREEELTMSMINGVSKLCPGKNCGWRVQKSHGCDHMKCSKCGHQFCYICLADWKKIIQHDNSYHKRGCKYYM